ncbi:MAG: hypothetical protein IJL95_03590 [Solobacterium sp.]|nr:hypothetical protein [Solobacterium sp.]
MPLIPQPMIPIFSIFNQNITISAAAIPATASVKGSRQHPDFFFATGFETGCGDVTRELACCGSGFDGRRSAAGLGEGIFLLISSVLLAGRTRVGAAGAELPGIFLLISSVLLAGRTRVCTEDAASAGISILFTISSALLTRLRPVLSFIAISFYSCSVYRYCAI